MRRIMLVALVGTAVVALPGNAVAAKKHHGKPKPKATFKTGTYTAKFGAAETKLNVSLKRGSCPAAPGQAKSSLQLCVALPVSPTIGCTVPINFEVPVGSFVAPVQLPSSGTVSQQAAITPVAAFPGSSPTTGTSTFSVTFTKKGTATGYFELSLAIATAPGQQLIPCSSGKVPFTAKLT